MSELRRIPHDRLSASDLSGLRILFDAEYGRSHGEWDPDAPYGYAPADVHVLDGDDPVRAHVGFQRRAITVGERTVVVGGTGGMLVAPSARGARRGERVLHELRAAMIDAGIEFGYLGCAPDVVPFYERAGWVRISPTEYHDDLAGRRVQERAGSPILICSASRDASEWPQGDVDLHGRPW